MIRAKYHLSHKQALWDENWPTLIMEFRDEPYFHHYTEAEKKKLGYDKKARQKPDDAIPGTNDILRTKFSKYMAK